MKKIYILTAVFALLTLSLNAQLKATKDGKVIPPKTSTEKVVNAPNRANRALSVTVGDQSTTSTSLPVNGLYQDYGYRSQMIYPSSLLSSNGLSVGDQIKSLTFYPKGGIKFAASTVTFKLCHTNTNNFGTSSNSSVSRISVGSDAVTATVTPTQDANATSWTITFGTPLTYNGGNLLLDVYCVGYNHDNTTGGACNTTTFYGTSQTNYQSMAYNGTRTETPAENGTGSNNKFLPRTTFGLLVTDPTIEASSDNVSLSAIPGSTDSKTINVSGYNLTGNISVSKSGQDASLFSVSPTTLSASGGSASGSLTISYSPTAIGNHTATIILSSPGAEDVTITLSGTCTNIVCNGTNTNDCLPVHGWYFEKDQHNQMVYPAEMLTGLVGKTLTSITFYPVSGINFKKTSSTNGTVSFSLGSLDANVDNVYDSSSPTLKSGYSSTPNGTIQMPEDAQASLTEWVITFTTPFTYTGGDLLVDVQTDHGTYGTTNFHGQEQDTYQSYYSRDGGSATAYKFLPKVTFAYSDPQHDLAVALSAPTLAGAGSTVTVTATVTNTGTFTEQGYTVTFTDGTTTITQTANASQSLEAGESTTFTADFTTDANDADQTVGFTVTVACTDDAVATNNSATASTALLTAPPPQNVEATPDNARNATVTWNAPNLQSVEVTEGFDDTSVFKPLSVGGITTTVHTSTMGDWTLYDPTGYGVYGFRNLDFTNDTEPHAWQVFDPSIAGTTRTPHSPNQYMMSRCVTGTINDEIQPTDHWLISPELSGEDQYINFYECVITVDYGKETYEFLVSSTNNDPSSFRVLQTTESDQIDWTLRTVRVPEGTKYFAIHHTSQDIFGMMVDDVTYRIIPKVVSYNIYLDGQLVDYVNSDVFEYTFNNVSSGEHVCAVSAVYDTGVESVAVPATFTILETTPTPEINVTQGDDYYVITATGDGIVTLTIGDQTVSGEGEVSITVSRRMHDYPMTATATAQEENKFESLPATENVTIPATTDNTWKLMDGTYSGDDVLSLTFTNPTTNESEPILFVDQFIGETMHNEHPDHYDYTVHDQDNADYISSKITIPVYKTYSQLNGLYTKDEVDNDALKTDHELTANAVNGTMAYDLKTGNDVFYYGLYRGELDAAHPEVENNSTISKLQQAEKNTGGLYFKETMNNAVTPKYSEAFEGDIKRVDKDYVVTTPDHDITYVPVIWTFGTNTGRIDGKNNSYGSDIKGIDIGEVVATVDGKRSNYDAQTHPTHSGEFKVDGVYYCVYAPRIVMTGTVPSKYMQAPDGEVYEYVPYMYRAWCEYENAHKFANDPTTHELIDAGRMDHYPFEIGSDYIANRPNGDNGYAGTDGEEGLIGGFWEEGQPLFSMPWAFGVPSNEDPKNVTFVIRFYYKKVVTQPSRAKGMRDGDEGEAYYAVETTGDGQGIVTAIDEMIYNRSDVISTTYVNSLGMQSDKPFEGLNIIITRYSDGTTTTTKVVR